MAGVAMFSGVLLGTCALGYGVSRHRRSGPAATADPRGRGHAAVRDSAYAVGHPATGAGAAAAGDRAAARLPTARGTPPPGPRLLGPGDHGPEGP